MKPLNVEICDVTLRDGEQTPGVTFACDEKKDIAQKLDAVGVEVIEAGFPSVSENEKKTVRSIVEMGLCAKTCCLSRCVKSDLDAAIDCGVDLVSIFFATSDLHIKIKYKKTREEMLDLALDMIDYANDHGIKVRFSAEEASRTDIEFLKEMYSKGAERGAAYSSFADTVGCMTPLEMYNTVKDLKKDLKNPLCVHCHNDMGFASANTFVAAQAGAFQLHTTVNAIGERAGNASLEEVLVALRMKGGVDRYNLSGLTELSKTVEKYSGVKVSKTKAVVGRNAFSHESGIHIAALLEDRNTYEYFPPEMVGGEQKFVLGKHTGRKGLEHVLLSLGYDFSPDEVMWVLNRVKTISEGKCSITKEVLMSVIQQAELMHKKED
ncbi:methanogen homocitrate synthase [Methanomicrobium sp. W14]|uniref:homocitrate synthase family protein n=1 Tax=Methanomicrobium sp. W14 TaxID=2817839 RepID=UPI001AEA134C|nr:homocitrate synthase family protein [Methanomicrobium sp. W14]MBP2134074.1 methanogen homocitrate synthase [Methanomicrobium sp. W14]